MENNTKKKINKPNPKRQISYFYYWLQLTEYKKKNNFNTYQFKLTSCDLIAIYNPCLYPCGKVANLLFTCKSSLVKGTFNLGNLKQKI